MHLLVTGGSGLLGAKIATLAQEKDHTVYIGYHRHEPASKFSVKFDVTDKTQVKKAFQKAHPSAVIHAAALTDVDRCELESEAALNINYQGTSNIATMTKKFNAFLVYVSTDYIFDGEKGMYVESDRPNPINQYGYSKLKGEEAIGNLECEACIARTSIIYGDKPATGKTNYALWLIEKLSKGEPVRIVSNQYSSPTLNTNLAQMILEIVEKKLTGIYHLAGSYRISRLEMAYKITDIFGLNPSHITPVTMKDMPWKAKRPRDSSLNVSKAQTTLENKPMTITEALNKLKSEIEE